MKIDPAALPTAGALTVAVLLPAGAADTAGGLAGVAVSRAAADQLDPDRNFYPLIVTSDGSPTARRLSALAWSAAGTTLLTWPLTAAARRLPGPRVLWALALGSAYAGFDSAMRDRTSQLRARGTDLATVVLDAAAAADPDSA